MTAKEVAMYANIATTIALLEQARGVRPEVWPIIATAKKDITAILIAIDLTCNGIVN